jgi:hypothetical protein
MDNAFGYYAPDHKCRHDNDLLRQWQAEGVNGVDANFSYADTRLIILVGALDTDTNVTPHANDYCAAVQVALTPVSEYTLDDTGHGIATNNGLKALTYAILDLNLGELSFAHANDCAA